MELTNLLVLAGIVGVAFLVYKLVMKKLDQWEG